MDSLNPRKLYIGNIPPQYTEADVVKDFSPFGRIEKIEFKGRFCFVEYNSSTCVSEALAALGGMIRYGERLIVKAYRHIPLRNSYQNGQFQSGYDRGVGQSKRTSFRVTVLNLDERTSWQDLKDFGRQVGEVNFADVIRGANDQKTGILEFFDENSMELAIRRLSGQTIFGSTVQVVPAIVGSASFTPKSKPNEPEEWSHRHSMEKKISAPYRMNLPPRASDCTQVLSNRSYHGAGRRSLELRRNRGKDQRFSLPKQHSYPAPSFCPKSTKSPLWNRRDTSRDRIDDIHESISYRHREPYHVTPSDGYGTTRYHDNCSHLSVGHRMSPYSMAGNRSEYFISRRRSRSTRNHRSSLRRNDLYCDDRHINYDIRTDHPPRFEEKKDWFNRIERRRDIDPNYMGRDAYPDAYPERDFYRHSGRMASVARIPRRPSSSHADNKKGVSMPYPRPPPDRHFRSFIASPPARDLRFNGSAEHPRNEDMSLSQKYPLDNTKS